MNVTETISHNVAIGMRLTIRGEDFLVVAHVENEIIEMEGISELVKGVMRFKPAFAKAFFITFSKSKLSCDILCHIKYVILV
jgi:hypothetical protein